MMAVDPPATGRTAAMVGLEVLCVLVLVLVDWDKLVGSWVVEVLLEALEEVGTEVEVEVGLDEELELVLADAVLMGVEELELVLADDVLLDSEMAIGTVLAKPVVGAAGSNVGTLELLDNVAIIADELDEPAVDVVGDAELVVSARLEEATSVLSLALNVDKVTTFCGSTVFDEGAATVEVVLMTAAGSDADGNWTLKGGKLGKLAEEVEEGRLKAD